MNFPFPAKKVPELRIIQITDTHLMDAPEQLLYGLNTCESLRKVLKRALADFPDTDLVLFTGDISQTGHDASYRIFQGIIEDLKLPVLCLPGNHDNPLLLNRLIPSSPMESAVFMQQENFSIVLLNSCVEQANYGDLDKNTLQQLQQFLQTSRSHFHIFAIHHTPALTNSKWLDELGLKNQHQLLSLIMQSNTPSLILSGHIHQALDLSMNQLRVLATPSTCHQFLAQSEHFQRHEPSQAAYRYIKVTLPNTIHTSVQSVEI